MTTQLGRGSYISVEVTNPESGSYLRVRGPVRAAWDLRACQAVSTIRCRLARCCNEPSLATIMWKGHNTSEPYSDLFPTSHSRLSCTVLA